MASDARLLRAGCAPAAIALAVALSVGTAAAQEAPSPSAPAAAPGATPNYVIGAGDRVRVTVWNQENVSGEYTVAGDGSFTFPLIGRVAAGGLTVAALEVELRRLLADGYFRDPQVTISVAEYRSKRVFLVGALRTPGAYPLTGDITLIEAIARAGSTTTDAGDHLFIIRSSHHDRPVLPGEDTSAEVIRIDLRKLNDGIQPAEARIEDGDTVYVPRAASIFVYGQVARPGSYPVGEDTTVRQALALAGGVSDFGAANRVRILRVVDGEERELRVKLNDRVRAGDTIVVPERFF